MMVANYPSASNAMSAMSKRTDPIEGSNVDFKSNRSKS